MQPVQHCVWWSQVCDSQKLSVLREAAENDDFDGIELDMQRSPLLLPRGHQWGSRHHLTQFVHSVRVMLQEFARKPGGPICWPCG